MFMYLSEEKGDGKILGNIFLSRQLESHGYQNQLSKFVFVLHTARASRAVPPTHCRTQFKNLNTPEHAAGISAQPSGARLSAITSRLPRFSLTTGYISVPFSISFAFPPSSQCAVLCGLPQISLERGVRLSHDKNEACRHRKITTPTPTE